MKDHASGDRFEMVHRAMDRVLEAESKARASIEACGVEADGILSKARDQARRITERTHRRISRVRKICDSASADQIKAIHREAAAEQATAKSESEEIRLIRDAARQLAERLTVPDGCE